MCGFVLFATNGGRPIHHEWVEAMLDTIRHRGPDDSGIHIESGFALGFRRLAILDLSTAGHQPMLSHDGRHAMVFNGEIYNYVELREELRSLGHCFKSSGDSEVLLAAYSQWGEACVDRLRGMFAFGVVERSTGAMFVARDRFGIKPLFMLKTADGVLFASEIKAIRKSGLQTSRPNAARFAKWLADGRMDAIPNSRETFLENIEQVMPGEALHVAPDGTVRRGQYFSPDAIPDDGCASIDDFAEKFDDAIRVHLRADVPIGVMLSGGMDSVSIACRFSALTGGPAARTQPIHAFCYAADDFDEETPLRDTIAQTGMTQHLVTDSSAERFWGLLPQLMWHHDEPVQSTSALVGFELYRLAASNGIRVVLSGQGADETLAGYPNYFDDLLVSLALRGRLPSLLKQADQLARDRKLSRNEVLWSCAKRARGTLLQGIGAYSRLSARRRTQSANGLRVLTPELTKSLAPLEPLATNARLGPSLRRSVTEYPLPMYLRVEDRNSMAHSIESRVPFLDHKLATYALRLPLEARVWDGWNKRALRFGMQGKIPESVASRRQKFGFPTGVRKWFSTSLASPLDDLVLRGAAVRSGWIDSSEVKNVLVEHRSGQKDHSTMLFNLAQLSVWLDWHARDWQ